MDDGLYRLRFNAAGTEVEGSLLIERNACAGGDARRHLRGEFTNNGNSLYASFDVACANGAPPPIGGAKVYSIKMFGNESDSGFNVIGVGPLGLIIEITGEWQAPLPVDGVIATTTTPISSVGY